MAFSNNTNETHLLSPTDLNVSMAQRDSNPIRRFKTAEPSRQPLRLPPLTSCDDVEVTSHSKNNVVVGREIATSKAHISTHALSVLVNKFHQPIAANSPSKELLLGWSHGSMTYTSSSTWCFL